MALKLWGSPTSGCTHRVMITLNELGIDYDLSQITLQKGEQNNPDYIKTYHPFGRIPVIQDGDLQLFESRAICRYIVAKFGASSSLDVITSGDPIVIGKFEKALSIDYSYFDPSVRTLCNEKLWKNPAEAANPLEVEKATAMFNTALDYYEDLLGSNSYLVGDASLTYHTLHREFGTISNLQQSFSLADIYVFTWMPYIKFLGLYDEVAARPKFEGLWKRVSTRPSWQKVLKDMPQ